MKNNHRLIGEIQNAKDIIGDEALPIIEEHLNIRFDKSNKAICPFHTEDTPSFVWNPKTHTARCFGCGKTYSILDYLIDKNNSYKKAVNELFKMAHVENDLHGFKPFDDTRKDWFANYVYPHTEQEPTEEHVVRYLSLRGISQTTIDYTELKEDKQGNIVFEYKDLDNKLLCVKYRVSHKVQKGEPKMWFQKDASTVPILWNVKKLDFTKPLLIVEGEIDCLSCIEAGWENVCSVPNGATGYAWLEYNYDFLQNFNQIVLWFDNDEAGQRGLDTIVPRLGEYRCRIVKPTAEDEHAVELYYQNFGVQNITKTDANNILLACDKQRVFDLINYAEEIPAKNLKYLMDCTVKDVQDMEKFSMGLQSLDNILYGNLMSCFSIYTGKPGSGKSSLLNLTSVIAPIEAGHKVFVFSGELSEGQLLSWILSPLAGLNHTKVWDSSTGGRKGFSVTLEAEAAIKKYYHDNIILYTQDDELETKDDDLINAMEVAYRKYGCDVFMIDNLLCLPIQGDMTESRWEAQKKFIIKLMGFTNNLGVTVNLVSHPKKIAQNEDVDIYSLHGASELSNLCHRLISVKRLNDDEDGYAMQVDIIKDRPSQAANKSCKLMYDYCTRRIYSTNEELTHKFNWEKNANIHYSEVEQKDLLSNRKDVLSTISQVPNYGEECTEM